MKYEIDFSIATSEQIEGAICKRLKNIRLTRNITQARLAEEAGVSLRTIRRLEKGLGVSLDTFIRVLIALDIQHNLEGLLPDPTIRPFERVSLKGSERMRASTRQSIREDEPWTWDDETDAKS